MKFNSQLLQAKLHCKGSGFQTSIEVEGFTWDGVCNPDAGGIGVPFSPPRIRWDH
jgi:hypothetical protein